MEETPKKLSNNNTNCFICLNTAEKRIRIFKGTSTFDIKGLIGRTLDIDINVYENCDAFTCIKCYKRLIKYQKAEDHVKEIKNELKALYGGHNKRVKRLQRTTDDQPEPKKKLAFRQTQSTACTSLDPPTFLDENAVRSGHFCLHEPAQFAMVYSSALAPLTSTPIRAKQVKASVEPSATITVEYPSKTVKRKLPSDLELLGKALAHGPASRIVKAIFKSKTLRAEVITQVLRVITKEVSELCSRRKPSLLRKTSKEDLLNFDLIKVCEEWKERAPVFYSFLLTCCSTKQTQESLPSLAVAGSILLKQRNNHMNATAAVLGILIKTGSIEVG